MLGSDGMVGAPDAVFDVADRRVDPLEGGDLDGLGAPAGDDGLVAAARLGDGAEAAEGVADHGGAGDQGAPAELFNLGLSEALDGVQLEAQRAALDGGFHRHDEGRLAGSPTAALAAATGAAEIGIVHLHALVGPADGRCQSKSA